jgi:2-polyprenyl-3-methyl-5-hydroxy-6-metoxy-1,4-benzoquinol methylase
MPDPTPQAARARDAWNLAAGGFDSPVVAFWDHCGAGLVARAGLRSGMRVLDACAGGGAASLPACRAVAPGGSVLAVDVAGHFLARARSRAAAAGITTLETRVADITTTDLPAGAFDGVLCAFAIFFLPDMDASLARLWRLVAPGGVVALSTWREGFWRPVRTILHEELERIRPDLVSPSRPWERVRDEAGVRDLFRRAGLPEPAVETEERRQPIDSPDDAWALALGTGYRWNLAQMAAGEVAALRERVIARARADDVRGFDATAIYAVARREA